ncbi:MAG: transcriptional regulator NrdR [Chlamydiota bacterium]
MRCPYCQYEESKVTDSRNAPDIHGIRRRRECLRCGKRFTTFETVDVVLQVKKRDGTYEDFQPDKLLRGLNIACRHSKISHEGVRAIAAEITKSLSDTQCRIVSAEQLGEKCMAALQERDVVAYIRFACVYKRLKDVEQLIEAIQSIHAN